MVAEPREPEDRGRHRAPRRERSPIGVTPPSSAVTEAGVVAGRGSGTTMEYQPRRIPLTRGLGALRHRDFRLFWSGQFVSLVGTWMQSVAQAWLVLVLTNSALLLGVVTALQFLPILTLSLLGGVVADRLPRRRILLVTQFSAMVLAFVLAALTAADAVQIGHVMVLALLLGIVNSVDMPTRQAFVVELVSREDLRNAIALNSASFNAARLVGPAVAGLAIGWVGLAGAFFINGLSFLAVIAGLLLVRTGRRPPLRAVPTTTLWEDLREGLQYVAGTPTVRLVVLLVAALGTFGMNMSVLVPLLAREVLQAGAVGFGLLTSALGAGSLLAAMLLAVLGQAPRRRLLLGSAAVLGLFQVALAGVQQFGVAVLLLMGTGFAMIFFTTLANIALQTSTPDALRGRVMSVYATVFVGTTPFGSLFAGGLVERWGVGTAFFVCGLISVAAVAIGYLVGRAVQDGVSAMKANCPGPTRCRRPTTGCPR